MRSVLALGTYFSVDKIYLHLYFCGLVDDVLHWLYLQVASQFAMSLTFNVSSYQIYDSEVIWRSVDKLQSSVSIIRVMC